MHEKHKVGWDKYELELWIRVMGQREKITCLFYFVSVLLICNISDNLIKDMGMGGGDEINKFKK